MKIGYYIFGNANIGTGHVYRGIQFAIFFLQRITSSQFVFFSKLDVDPHLKELIEKHGFTLQEIGELNEKIDCLFIDRLEVDILEMQKLRSLARILVSIDDKGPARKIADFAFSVLYSPSHEGIQNFSYAMVDPQLASVEYTVQDSVKNILLVQGGSDPNSLLSPMVHHLQPLLSHHQHIVLNVKIGMLSNLSENMLPSNQLRIHSGVKISLIPFYSTMDVAISAGGVTALELLALGIPTILVSATEREFETIKSLCLIGAAIQGECGTNKFKLLLSQTESLVQSKKSREKLSLTSRKVIDGKGFSRIAEKILERLADDCQCINRC